MILKTRNEALFISSSNTSFEEVAYGKSNTYGPMGCYQRIPFFDFVQFDLLLFNTNTIFIFDSTGPFDFEEIKGWNVYY